MTEVAFALGFLAGMGVTMGLYGIVFWVVTRDE